MYINDTKYAELNNFNMTTVIQIQYLYEIDRRTVCFALID